MEQRKYINTMSEETGVSKSFMASGLGMSRQNFNNFVAANRLSEEHINKLIELTKYDE